MLKEVYKIDERGFIAEIHVADVSENGDIVDTDKQGFIVTDLPQPLYLYRPKWNGTEWIEGESNQERAERESQQLLEALNPLPKELADADLEIKMITLLMEMEVI